MDFWRIFENFGFAVLVLKLPTYGLFWPLVISTLHFHQAPTTIYIKTQKSNGLPGILDTMGCQKMALRAYTPHCIWVLCGAQSLCQCFFGTEEVRVSTILSLLLRFVKSLRIEIVAEKS